MENAEQSIDWVFDGIHLPGTRVTYTCNEEFVLNPPQYSGVICGENGAYAAVDPEYSNGTCVRGYYLVCFFGSKNVKKSSNT